ncbi:D-3-phosphoglycerate dehydrogenase [Striga asiatica]|uniref:D-3-phosphoglycerate dehydrogenase n=1 Tax=Striga asiatica TaxID=4170 RepID=A0A5A7Q5S7_STRAF|nr:D-3-phosphoglycerate dehydrogenase [Striga asiatica]
MATSTMAATPGPSPSTFMAAGNAMIPAPIMVVDRLRTAPVKEAPLNSWRLKLLLALMGSVFWGSIRGALRVMARNPAMCCHQVMPRITPYLVLDLKYEIPRFREFILKEDNEKSPMI